MTKDRLGNVSISWRETPAHWTIDASPARLRRLLVRWANISTAQEAESLVEKYRDLFWFYIVPFRGRWETENLAGNWSEGFLQEVQRLGQRIREAWLAKDVDTRQRRILNLNFDLLALYVPEACENIGRQDIINIFPQLQADDPFRKLFHIFTIEEPRCKVCQSMGCLEPCFMGRGTKFCSAECAGRGERDRKLKWWRRNQERLRPVAKEGINDSL